MNDFEWVFCCIETKITRRIHSKCRSMQAYNCPATRKNNNSFDLFNNSGRDRWRCPLNLWVLAPFCAFSNASAVPVLLFISAWCRSGKGKNEKLLSNWFAMNNRPVTVMNYAPAFDPIHQTIASQSKDLRLFFIYVFLLSCLCRMAGWPYDRVAGWDGEESKVSSSIA